MLCYGMAAGREPVLERQGKRLSHRSSQNLRNCSVARIPAAPMAARTCTGVAAEIRASHPCPPSLSRGEELFSRRNGLRGKRKAVVPSPYTRSLHPLPVPAACARSLYPLLRPVGGSGPGQPREARRELGAGAAGRGGGWRGAGMIKAGVIAFRQMRQPRPSPSPGL